MSTGGGPAAGAREVQVDSSESRVGYPAFFPPRWAPVASGIICLLALADSAYLTYAHYTAAKIFACSTSGFVNCSAVTTGPYSEIIDIPVAVLGLAWSFGMLMLCSPPAWRASVWEAPGWRSIAPWVSRLRLAGS
ncbi:MAG TPA: vitamin K epoxide reductase family protein, partial [Acidimicrobiales bacterium]|nr:vitamin K epoxide reductase family protein [Acidimicrobiales bacterium]